VTIINNENHDDDDDDDDDDDEDDADVTLNASLFPWQKVRKSSCGECGWNTNIASLFIF
jgi:hypothetical protein